MVDRPPQQGDDDNAKAQEHRRRLAAPAAALALLVFLVLGNLDDSLGRIEVAGLPAYKLTSVSSWFQDDDSIHAARQAWCLWRSYAQGGVVLAPGTAQQEAAKLPETGATACYNALYNHTTVPPPTGDGTAARLVRWYVGLDLLFIVLYSLLAIGVVRRRSGPGIATWGPLLVLAVVVVAEAIEDTAQWLLGHATASAGQVDLAGRLLAYATPSKFILVGVLALLLAVLVLRPLVDVGARTLTDRGEQRRTATTRAVGLLRIQIVVVAIFGLLMSGIGQNQVADALLRWGDLDLHGDRAAMLLGAITLFGSLLALAYFATLLWRSARRAALTKDSALGAPPLWVLAGIAGLCILAWLLWPRWPNLGGLGIALVVLVVLSGFSAKVLGPAKNRPSAMVQAEGRADLVDAPDRIAVTQLARWLAAVPVGLVAIALVRTALPPLLVLGSPKLPGAARLLLLVVLGVALLGVAVAIPGLLYRFDRPLLHTPDEPVTQHSLYWWLAAPAAAAIVLAWHPESRLWFPVLLGPVTIVILFLALVLVAGIEVQRYAERTAALEGLHVLGARRNPVLALLLAWFLLGSLLDTDGPHAVRVLDEQPQVTRLTVAKAFENWKAANCALGPGPVAGTDLPMVFVAAQGGGIRAAYWTAGVLESLFPSPQPPPTQPSEPSKPCNDKARKHDPVRNRVFALSGASGGSVGISFWLNAPAVQRPWYQRPAVSDTNASWYDTALSVDHLSDALSWLLYVDAPRSLLGFRHLPDRAALMEQSWEQSQPQLDGAFLHGYPAAGSPAWRPLALLNGTAVESGCRALTAPVSLTRFDDGTPGAFGCQRIPATPLAAPRGDATGLYDLTEQYLCPDQDLRMSTAALLSARFVYISPTGRLDRCGQPGSRTYVVDGGYLDNSGSMSITDLYLETLPLIVTHNQQVARCASKPGCTEIKEDQRPTRRILPIFLQIDNGYTSVAQPGEGGRPRELGAPAGARQAVAGTVEETARQRSYKVFGDTLGDDRVVRIANAPHPGVQAPLGWVLSASARDDLCHELGRLILNLPPLIAKQVVAPAPKAPPC